MVLRRAEAVEAGGIIGPIGVAEVERAVGEVEALQRNPGPICQICGGLYHAGDAGGSGDVEANMAAGRVQRAGLRIPPRRPNIAKKWTPAPGAGEIIDDNRILEALIVEHMTRVGGRVSYKIGGSQAAAIVKRPVSDTGDASGDDDAGEAISERTISNAGEAIAHRDAAQPDAIEKRIVSAAGYAVGNGDAGQAAVTKRIVSDADDAQAID